MSSRASRTPPPCHDLGPDCRSLKVVLRASHLDQGLAGSDHELTWLLGHTERMTFGKIWWEEDDLYVETVIHVPCKYLAAVGRTAHCRAHGHSGPLPRARARPAQPRQLDRDRFLLAASGVLRPTRLPRPPVPATNGKPGPAALPILDANPCQAARCRTTDHRLGAACCRDLQVEIMCTTSETFLEGLIRSRQSPYLCKVERNGEYSVDVEVISACGYLETGGVGCTLHGRSRRDGRPAKPALCSAWPPKREVLHAGCVFGPKRRRARVGG